MSNENKRPEVESPSEIVNLNNAVTPIKTEMQDSAEPPSKRAKLEESNAVVKSTTIQQNKVEPKLTAIPNSSVPATGSGTHTVHSAPITAQGPPKHDLPSQLRIGKETPPPPPVTEPKSTNTQNGTGCSPIVTPNPAPTSKVNNESAKSTVASTPVKEEPLVVTVADPEAKTTTTSAALATTAKAHPPPPITRVPPASKTIQEKSSPQKEVPLKSTTMYHLKTKYTAELEYMLREFRKLERQLLGAKGAAQLEESAGSRERREKLHSFILHLEDTIRQIETGCALEAEGKSTIVNRDADAPSLAADSDDAAKKQMAESSALTNLTKEKEEEENVQKLEEHILANLLPVKVRLKKQLAAQQGASRNPAGMPAPRRGSLQPSATARGQGTFAEAAEKRRKQAEAARLAAQEEKEQAVRRVSDPTQFGKPLGGGGSSLTQKLHGPTLGSTKRPHGHGVGSSQKSEVAVDQQEARVEKKILYAGMVPGSTQHKSGVLAASGVHEMTIEDTKLQKEFSEQKPAAIAPTPTPSAAPIQTISQVKVKVESVSGAHTPKAAISTPKSKPQSSQRVPPAAVAKTSAMAAATVSDDANLTEAEKRKLRKKRRKKKLLRLKKRREKERHRHATLHQQAQASQSPTKGPSGKRKAVTGKGQGKKKGPRSVEYICALCSEAYTSSCDYNPWWALAQHECPKCRKTQIPRIDITSPANAIEYHPALLAHVDENGGGGAAAAAAAANIVHAEQPPAVSTPLSGPLTNLPSEPAALSDSESELSELSDDSLSACSSDSEGSVADLQSMTAAERAEHESFGHDYKGPVLSDDHAGRLLVLMSHASTCPCRHKSQKHRDICISTKYMMLHVRDCPGTTSTFDVCPYPWCRKVKHLLYHLVSCADPDSCSVCNPKELSQNMHDLIGLNQFRVQKYRERLVADAKAASATSCRVVPVPPVSNVSTVPAQSTTAVIHPPPQKLPGTSKSKNTKQKSVATAKRSKPTVKHRTAASAKNAQKAATVVIKPKQSLATRIVTTAPATVVNAAQGTVTTPRISNTAPQTTGTTAAARTVQVKQQQVVKPAVAAPAPVVNTQPVMASAPVVAAAPVPASAVPVVKTQPAVANAPVAASTRVPASTVPCSTPASVHPTSTATLSPPSTAVPTLKAEPAVKIEPVDAPAVAVPCQTNPVAVTALAPVAPVPVVAKPQQAVNPQPASSTTQYASGNLAQCPPNVPPHAVGVKIEPPVTTASVIANKSQSKPNASGPVVAAPSREGPNHGAALSQKEVVVQGQATVSTTVQTTPVEKATVDQAHVPATSVPTANTLVQHQNQPAEAIESVPAVTATTNNGTTTVTQPPAVPQESPALPREAQEAIQGSGTSQSQTAPATSPTVVGVSLNSPAEPSAQSQTNTNTVDATHASPFVDNGAGQSTSETTVAAPSDSVGGTSQEATTMSPPVTNSSQPTGAAIVPSPTTTDQPLAATPVASDVRAPNTSPVGNVANVSTIAKEDPTSSNNVPAIKNNAKIPGRLVNTNSAVSLLPVPGKDRSTGGGLGSSSGSVELDATTRGGAPTHSHTEVGKAADIVKVN